MQGNSIFHAKGNGSLILSNGYIFYSKQKFYCLCALLGIPLICLSENYYKDVTITH